METNIRETKGEQRRGKREGTEVIPYNIFTLKYVSSYIS